MAQTLPQSLLTTLKHRGEPAFWVERLAILPNLDAETKPLRDVTFKLGLNIILSDGERLVGTRFNRSLYFVDRKGVYDCEICGFPHIHHDPDTEYRAIVVASEPVTQEDWIEIPNHSIWQLDTDDGINIHKLREYA